VRGTCIANATLDAYARHFAGRARWECDPHLLGDLVEHLVSAHENIVSSGLDQESGDAIARAIRTCREEAMAIAQSQALGNRSERLDMLAQIANLQFRCMEIHLAGRPRVVLRPGLLARLENALRHTHAEMMGLGTEGSLRSAIEQNAATVHEMLGQITAERQACTAARADAGRERLRWMLLELAEELGAADTIVGARAPTGVGDVCDALFEVLVQLPGVLGEQPQEVSVFARTAEAHSRICGENAKARAQMANQAPAASGGQR
jgi:hypothetical protein